MENSKNNRTGYTLIIIFSLISIIGILNLQAIPQDTHYHLFSDTRTLFDISNFSNVISNLPFLIVGLSGLYTLLIKKKLKGTNEFRIAYITLFSAVSLVSFGSGYYHLAPDNQTLIWDRIPMTITFMSLFTIIISEFISLSLARILLLPLIIIGISSVFYWQFSEISGEGDLRPYILVQFLPMLLIPVIFFSFKSKYTSISGYWWLFTAYIAAKFFEHFDQAIHLLTTFISGHSLKHITAAIGVSILIIYYKNRQLTAKKQLI